MMVRFETRLRIEQRITPIQRRELVDDLIELKWQITNPERAFRLGWERLEPYTVLLPIIHILESDQSLPVNKEIHLKKMAALKASRMDRDPVPGFDIRGVWAVIDENLSEELAIAAGLPQDLVGAPRTWINANFDLSKIEQASFREGEK